MTDFPFPAMNAGILASFQTAMENIASARLKDTFSSQSLKREILRKPISVSEYYPTDQQYVTGMASRHTRSSHNRLSMGIVGCLPDNVQKAIRSFSIKPGKQHFTIAFPFMADTIRSAATDSNSQKSDPNSQLRQAMYIDIGPEVISGFRTLTTLVMNKQSTSLVLALLTLFEVGSTEGVLRHFESMIRIMIHPNTPITLWKYPLCITDLDSRIREAICSTSAEAILDVQQQNLQNSFPGKSRQELYQYLKDKVIAPRFRPYTHHLYCCLRSLADTSVVDDHCHIVAMMEHIRNTRCSHSDFHKVDSYLKASTSTFVKTLWIVWGHEQIASKVFPVAKTARGGRYLQLSNHSDRNEHPESAVSMGQVSIKEGLKNIIDSLKQQETSRPKCSLNSVERVSAGCMCGNHDGVTTDSSTKRTTTPAEHRSSHDQSAFYRPRSGRRYRMSTTPYSDALKAVAVSPYRLDTGRKHLTYKHNKKAAELYNGLLTTKRFYTPKTPHLHSLYCDFFGTKHGPTVNHAEPTSTTTL